MTLGEYLVNKLFLYREHIDITNNAINVDLYLSDIDSFDITKLKEYVDYKNEQPYKDFSFNILNGNLYCNNSEYLEKNNKITSMIGLPKIVNGDISLYGNDITTLDGIPKYFKSINLASNKINNLKLNYDITFKYNIDLSYNSLLFECPTNKDIYKFKCKNTKSYAIFNLDNTPLFHMTLKNISSQIIKQSNKYINELSFSHIKKIISIHNFEENQKLIKQKKQERQQNQEIRRLKMKEQLELKEQQKLEKEAIKSFKNKFKETSHLYI